MSMLLSDVSRFYMKKSSVMMVSGVGLVVVFVWGVVENWMDMVLLR